MVAVTGMLGACAYLSGRDVPIQERYRPPEDASPECIAAAKDASRWCILDHDVNSDWVYTGYCLDAQWAYARYCQ